MPSSIIDNRDQNTLLRGIQRIGEQGTEICIATAFFSLDALLLVADTLEQYQKVRILFGDDADAVQRKRLLQMLRERSEEDLNAQRETYAFLTPLKRVEALFAQGRVEARCYTAKKFHAKAYLMQRPFHPQQMGVLGSGNFTRAGLTQNIELNVELTPEQTEQLGIWFEERWAEAEKDVVTDDVLHEIRRQVDLYDPYILYLKALLTWGEEQAASHVAPSGTLENVLDPHQEIGFRQAIRILERQNGVFICDGVGLGKSFIALALMERYCRMGKRVLLVAPKSILESSWKGYLEEYLARYRAPYGSICEKAMTEFGFNYPSEPTRAAAMQAMDDLDKLAERADVIVVDESHNFRTTSSLRYKNLMRVMAPSLASGRKKVVLLTATPINTAYTDLSAQMELITHEEGTLAGYGIAALKRAANEMDKAMRDNNGKATDGLSLLGTGQLTMEMLHANDNTMRTVLESVVIQRSRRTCRELAHGVGKQLHFPLRRDPQTVGYNFEGDSKPYRDMIELADKRFRSGINLLNEMKKAEAAAQEKGKRYDPMKLLSRVKEGIKLAAFLPGQYLLPTSERNVKQDKDEIHLARLVYTNVLKQLESSPIAFQGIMQSIAIGLIARLSYVLQGDADSLIQPHLEWVRTPLFARSGENDSTDAGDTEDESLEDTAADGDALEKNGAETDKWLTDAINTRNLQGKLAGFGLKTHEVDRWTKDIVLDLQNLKDIHEAILNARKCPDPKLAKVVEILSTLTGEKRRVLVFTQSQRTADYLERELKDKFPNLGIARIDSRVKDIRPSVLHAFSPNYNPKPAHWSPSVPNRVDILICTDVLSEGVNLQEAGAILNYDIHWNPVRLIQRIGRVDRRLNPAVTPVAHDFYIYNVLPPDDIEKIIDLVGKVEGRTLKISRTLGLDAAFFKATDDVGTLKEFNATYEGDLSDADTALKNYLALTDTATGAKKLDADQMARVNAVPPGAFGVWRNAPRNGLFALWVMEAKKSASDADRKRFAAQIGRPVLSLMGENGRVNFDAGEILTLLSGTVLGEKSATPSDETKAATDMKKMRNAVRQQFNNISLPASIMPKLVCWMELRKN